MIKNLSTEPIPGNMQHLPLWNGFPIPYFTLIQGNEPQWPVLDTTRILSCMMYGDCDICGRRLTAPGYYYFIGGELSMKNKLFVHSPAHADCARYACKVCPYLAGTARQYRDTTTGMEIVGIAERPARMGLMCAKSWQPVSLYGTPMALAGEVRWVDWTIMPESRPRPATP